MMDAVEVLEVVLGMVIEGKLRSFFSAYDWKFSYKSSIISLFSQSVGFLMDGRS